jgi:hypothetical protein
MLRDGQIVLPSLARSYAQLNLRHLPTYKLIVLNVAFGSRLCEKSVVQFACGISVSISSMRKRIASVLL